MKFSIALLGFLAAQALCNPVEGTELQVRDHSEEHPALKGITSPMYNPDAPPEDLQKSYGLNETELEERTSPLEEGGLEARNSLEARKNCPWPSGRGVGMDYDYGCDKGWCWRNCNGPFLIVTEKKSWCWLAYDNGEKSWTPCGRWQDCEWSYNNKKARCGKGNCKACGCGC